MQKGIIYDVVPAGELVPIGYIVNGKYYVARERDSAGAIVGDDFIEWHSGGRGTIKGLQIHREDGNLICNLIARTKL